MQNIHVKRYNPQNKHWAGTVAPQDDSWVMFIDTDGEPSLYRRVQLEVEPGKVEETFVNVESECWREKGQRPTDG